MKIKAIHAIDLYKADHRRQYPENTEFVYSNFTPRASHLAPKSRLFDGKVVCLGLQGVIQWLFVDLFNDTFFNQPKEKVVQQYQRRMNAALGDGVVTCDHIGALHDLGYLPLLIKAIPEGSAIGMKIPMFTIRNTHTNFAWLTNYVESAFSSEVWKTCTSASTARQFRMLLDEFAKRTGCAPESVMYQAHDFAFRGMSGIHDAAQSSIGHLLAFRGSDTLLSYDYIDDYYQGESTYIGGGVAATEHSVMCAGGKQTEIDTFVRLISKVYPTGIASIVSDTWNFWNVVEKGGIANQLKDMIEGRVGINSKVVFRPDSGNPEDIICGNIDVVKVPVDSFELFDAWVVEHLADIEINETAHGECGNNEVEGLYEFDGVIYLCNVEIDWNRYDKQYYYADGQRLISKTAVELTSEQKGALQCLWEVFGGTVNEMGFKVLNPKVGLIYGDSITLERADSIFSHMMKLGFASSNLVIGVGSYTYQFTTRDSYGFAMKATHAVVDGEGFEIFKDPITDSGTKKSAKGLLRVELENNEYKLYDMQTELQEQLGELRVVFEDGEVYNVDSFETIRNRFELTL